MQVMEELTRLECNTKEKLLSNIQSLTERYIPYIEIRYNHSHFFSEAFKKYITDFICQIEEVTLIEPLPNGWEYSWFIDYQTAEVIVEHNEIMVANDPTGYNVDQKFVLISVEAPTLTAEEFANRCETNVRTVTQWIRRGKLKTAYKAGNTWKISELTEKPKNRGYIEANYIWDKKLIDLPEEFMFLNQYDRVEIKKSDRKSDKFNVYFFEPNRGDGSYPEAKVYSSEERENLETLLIAHPNITYIPINEYSIMQEIYNSVWSNLKY